MPAPASASKADTAKADTDTPAPGDAQRPDPGDPGAGYEWVTTQWLEELVDARRGERRTYRAGEVYEGDRAADYVNPDPAEFGASGPLLKKRKIRVDDGAQADTEGN